MLVNTESKSGWDLNFGYYLKVTFILRNDGKKMANNVRIKLYVEDQNKEKEFDNSFHVIGQLAPGDTVRKNITIDYEMGIAC